MEELRQEFERYAGNGQELGVQVWIEGERYEFHFTDTLGETADPDSMRIFKSLGCRAAAAARLNHGQAGPEDWKLWLRHLCDVDPKFETTIEATWTVSEDRFNSLKESGEPTEGFVCETVEYTEADLIEDARLIYSRQLHGVDFDQFVELCHATADLPQMGDGPRMPRVGDSITKYRCGSKHGQLLRIFNASAIRCMELGSLAPSGEITADPEADRTAKSATAKQVLALTNGHADANRMPKKTTGPPPLSEKECLAVADIVRRVAPDGNWRSKLDDLGFALYHGICDAADPESCDRTDHEKIPLPRGWAGQDATWTNPPNRAAMVKAIKERLKRARTRSEAETPA
jgi:hypothetical protein